MSEANLESLAARYAGTRVLVTGGAGFIGSRVAARLAQYGASVTVLDDLFTGSKDNLARVDADLRIGSVADENAVLEAAAGKDFIFHLAARNITVSTTNPRDALATNTGGTLNVLLAAREHRTRRIVYASTSSIYGNPRHLPIDENDPPHILSSYAASKFGGESYSMAFHETYDLPVSIVRYSNVFGPFQDPANPYCGVVAKFISALEGGARPAIHGDGLQTRDYTYVDDAVDATLAVALSTRAEGEAFNIGTGIETSVYELCATIARLMNVEFAPVHIERRDIDNIRRRVVAIEKIRSRVRWIPRFTLEEGLRRTVEWSRARRSA